jgi:GTP-binding protein
MQIQSAVFVKSTNKLRQRPLPELPELAFIGRSNVGKSSLINALLQRQKLAKTSSRPGKTQLINYFLVNDSFYCVDLPGYGYAKVPLSEKEKWREFIEDYLRNSPALRCVVLLADARHGLKKSDLQMLEWLRFYERPFLLVYTKIDKLSRSQQEELIQATGKQYGLTHRSHFFLHSARTGAGREGLWLTLRQFIV